MASINSVVKRKQFIWLGIVLATVGAGSPAAAASLLPS